MTRNLEDRAALVDRGAIEAFVAELFGRVRWREHHVIGLRGIGEKGTAQEGVFREDEYLQPGLVDDGDELIVEAMYRAALRYAQHEIATFCVPAVLGRAQGSAAAVELMTAIVVDLDTGNSTERAEYLTAHLGEPTMAVMSGGTTDAGTPKLHLYWVLDEPTEDVALVVRLRDELARKIGGDLQFGLGRDGNPLGRAHQPIRVGGSVHGKGGQAHPVAVYAGSIAYDFMDLASCIREMPPSPWAIKDEDAPHRPALGLNFSPTNRFGGHAIEALVTDIEEGGEGDRNRWTEFSRVAGHYIHTARAGAMSLEEARSATLGWMAAHMIPPWPPARAEAEWHNLVQLDVQKHGPFIAVEQAPALVAPAADGEEAVPLHAAEDGLAAWGVHRWEPMGATRRTWLVEGLIQAAKPHLFVAEGAAGKTQSMLQFAMMIADRQPYLDDRWLGCRIVTDRPRIVVILTTEDDRDELAIRYREIDVGGQRIRRAGDLLIVVPLANYGGAFPIVARDRFGNAGPSPQWLQFLELLGKLPAALGADPGMVWLDTVNGTMHGDENSAQIVQEYMRAATMVCSMGWALGLAHHPRKANTERPIVTADDMLAAVRGSTALVNSVRIAIGLWAHPYWKKALEDLGEEPAPKKLYFVGVLKGNTPETLQEPRVLLRGNAGLLFDVTARARAAAHNKLSAQEAWIAKAVELAALAGAPYTITKKGLARADMTQRIDEIHPVLADQLGKAGLAKKLLAMVDDGRIVRVERLGNVGDWLDVPHGPYAQRRVSGAAGESMDEPPDWSKYQFDAATGTVVLADGPRFNPGGAPTSDT